jgi:ubiquinone/menaquinone biosynthesis C-methylase UbiE
MTKSDALRTEGITMGRWARFYDLICTVGGLGTGFKRRIVRLAKLTPEERVLDVCCGTGVLTCLAAQQAAGAVGIDGAPEMIDVARAKAARQGLAVDFRVALIEAIPFPDGHFDVAFTTLIIHCLPPAVLRAGLRDVLRVLKPGGRLLVADFDREGQLGGLLREVGFGEVKPLGKAWLLAALLFGRVALWEARKA